LLRFYGEELLAPRPTLKLEEYPLSAVRDCLFNIFADTLHLGGRSSIHNLSTRLLWWQGHTYHGHWPGHCTSCSVPASVQEATFTLNY